MDVEGFVEEYHGLSQMTRHAYRNSLEMLRRHVAGDEPTDEEVRNFLRGFKKGTTLQRHKAAIRLYYFYKGNRPWPFDRRSFIPAVRRLPRYLDRSQIARLIEAAENEQERMFVLTLFRTAMRISELRSLTQENIEPDGIRLIVKGDEERMIPVSDSFIAELQEYARKRKDKLFPDTYWNYWMLLRRLCMKAGVPPVSPHTLRHSAAVDLINRGLPLGGVQRLLGHKRESTTMIYAQLTELDLRKALRRLEEE